MARRQQRKVQLGTISHGTLRTEDLLGEFLSTLEYLAPTKAAKAQNGYRRVLRRWEEDGWDDLAVEDKENLEYCLEGVTEALEELAPPFCYFGCCEGDGSDFGFWYSDDTRRDAVRDGEMWEGPDNGSPSEWPKYFASLAEFAAQHFSSACSITDHGNVTIYSIRYRYCKGKPVSVSFSEIISVV